MPYTQTLLKVAILLCTYHGQHYLANQLDSLATQNHNNWTVWASDDGSQDDTHAIPDAANKEITLSPLFNKRLGFTNACGNLQ